MSRPPLETTARTYGWRQLSQPSAYVPFHLAKSEKGTGTVLLRDLSLVGIPDPPTTDVRSGIPMYGVRRSEVFDPRSLRASRYGYRHNAANLPNYSLSVAAEPQHLDHP